jgi:hypothetical protein
MVPVALPLVLSLVDAFLALSAVLIGLGVSSAHHERTESSRVALAAQRGALDLVTRAAPWGALFLVVILAVGSIASALGGRPARDLLWVGIVAASFAAGGAWLAGWQVARFSAGSSGAAPVEIIAAKLARLTCSSLLLGAAAGSGLSALCFATLPSRSLEAALTGAVAGVGLLIVLARPSVLSWAAAGHVQRRAALHPGSLAALVGSTYTSTWLLHASLFAVSAIGQIALFALARDATEGVGTYALLLPRIGLFALVCAGLGSRISTRDALSALWLRELLIALVVLAGGAWMSRGVLAATQTRTWAPALVCYLCVTFGVGVWVLGTRVRESSFVSPLSLLPVLLLALIVGAEAVAGGTTTILLLVVASALALLPLAAVFRVTSSALLSARTCDLLATSAGDALGREENERPIPSSNQQELFLPMASLVALGFATTCLDRTGAPTDPLVFGMGALCSAFLLRGLSRSQEGLARAGGRRLAELSGKQEDEGGLLLGEGLAVLERVGGQGQLTFAIVLLTPPLLLSAYAATGSPSAMTLAAGSALGALFWPVMAEFPGGSERTHAAHAALVWPLALYHLAWSALVLTLGRT